MATAAERAWEKVLYTAAVNEDFCRMDVLKIAEEYVRWWNDECRTSSRPESDRPVLVAAEVVEPEGD